MDSKCGKPCRHPTASTIKMTPQRETVLKFQTLLFAQCQSNSFTDCESAKRFFLRPRRPEFDIRQDQVIESGLFFPLLHRVCCFDYFFNIPTHALIIYTLKSTKFTLEHLKTLKICPYMLWSILKTIFRRLVDSTLCSY